MNKLTLLTTALSFLLLIGCAAQDKMGSKMDTMDEGMQTEEQMDKDTGHMDGGTMDMNKDKMKMDNDMNGTHDTDGM